MKFLAAIASLFLAVALPAAAATTPVKPAAAKRIVLPTDVRPDRYDIRIKPDAENLRFDGEADIDVTVLRGTDRIVLNAADLEFRFVGLSGRDGGAAYRAGH